MNNKCENWDKSRVYREGEETYGVTDKSKFIALVDSEFCVPELNPSIWKKS